MIRKRRTLFEAVSKLEHVSIARAAFTLDRDKKTFDAAMMGVFRSIGDNLLKDAAKDGRKRTLQRIWTANNALVALVLCASNLGTTRLTALRWQANMGTIDGPQATECLVAIKNGLLKYDFKGYTSHANLEIVHHLLTAQGPLVFSDVHVLPPELTAKFPAAYNKASKHWPESCVVKVAVRVPSVLPPPSVSVHDSIGLVPTHAA